MGLFAASRPPCAALFICRTLQRAFRPSALLGALVLTAPALAQSPTPLTWNPYSEFSITSGNPNGVWRYGYMDTGFTTFTPYSNQRAIPGSFTHWYGWGGDETPNVGINPQTTTINGVPGGVLQIHPGNGNEPSVLRWTAPLTARVRVKGDFLAGNSGVMQVAVRKSSTVLFSASDAGAFDLMINVTAGDTLDFAVFGGYVSGDTGLQLTITSLGADAFANRTTLSGTSLSVSGSNTGATKETNEPSHAGNAGGASVWWTWTAPKTGVVNVSTIGSNFDTLLGVYTGTSVSALTTVASDDNSGPGNTSKLTFNATAGTTYRIAVDGSGGASGTVQLNLDYAYYFFTLAGTAGASGTTDGSGAVARFNGPDSLAVHQSTGDLYVADRENGRVRKITPAGVVSTVVSGFTADDNIDGVAIDSSGLLYFSVNHQNAVKRLVSGDSITTFASGGSYPNQLAFDSAGNLYIAYAGGGNPNVVNRVTPAGNESTFLGGLNIPTGVALDPSGNVFIADQKNHVVRKVTSGGTASVFAGTVGSSGEVDGFGTSVRLTTPVNVATDAAGNVYVIDVNGGTVRRISSTGLVTTIGGLAGSLGTVNGIGSTARFNTTRGIAVDATGNLYVAERGSHVIRKGVPAYAPEVNSLSPSVIAAGGTVTVTGAYFAGATEVRFNGLTATSYTVLSETSISAVFPAGATAGPVTVVGPGGTSAATVNVSPASPPVVALTSESGSGYSAAAGTASIRVRITYTGQTPSAIGATLQLPAGWTFASYSGPIALATPTVGDNLLEWAFSSFPANELTFLLTADYPAGQSGAKAITGTVNYRPGNLSLTLPTLSFDLVPTVSSLSTSNLFPGASVTITGRGFTGATAVKFNNVDAASITIVNDTTVTAVAPDGLTSGAVTVAGAGGASNATVAYTAVVPAPHAQDRFDPNANGDIYATVVQPDGKIIIGGSFTTLTPNLSGTSISATRIARLKRDGSVDSTFTASADQTVYALALQSADGKILIGGAFTTVNSTARNRIARLNANGTLDPDFNPNANGQVQAIAVQPDGKILLGGSFGTLNPNNTGAVTRTKFARLLNDGTLDPLNFTITTSEYGVRALHVLPDASILVAGDFSTVNSVSRNYIFRITSAGAVDTAFGPSLGGVVHSVARQADGKILLGGEFTSFGGVSGTSLARLNADLSVDTSFSPAVGYSVSAIAVQADGKIVLGGFFTAVAGQTRQRLARLNPSGSLDTGFTVNANGNRVHSLAIQPDGGILVGGDFSTLGGHGRNRIARVLPEGAVERALIADTDGTVEVAVRQPDGKLLIGGAFGSVGGVSRTNLARLNADSSVDTTFPNIAPLGVVRAIVVQPDGRIVIGGGFSTSTGLSVNRSGVARLTAEGAIDSGFAADLNSGASVNALLLQADGKLVVGGTFTSAGGTVRNNLLRLNADGSLDSGFNPGANNTVTALALQANGAILLGGAFTNAGGSSRGRLARVDSAGVLDATFNPGANGTPRAIVVQPDGGIVVGGSFAAIANNAATNLARLNLAGGFDGSFGATTNQQVNALAQTANGRLLLGGNFSSITNLTETARDYLAVVDGVGVVDATFNPFANGAVTTVSLSPDGKVTVGGNFTSLGGQARSRLARLVSNQPTETRISATTSTLTLTRTGPLPELSWVTFERSTDGNTWTSLGNATRVGATANWQLTGVSLSANSLFYVRARAAAPTTGYGSSSLVEHVHQLYLAAAVVAPTIASVTPSLAAPGMKISVTGTGFTGATAVSVGGVAANFTVESSTQLTAIVPAGATSGSIGVTVGGVTSSGGPGATIPKNRYTFNGTTVTDSAGSDHGTLIGGATLSGGRLVLDGVDDYVQFATKIVPTSGPITVAMFAQQFSNQLGGFVELISQGSSGAPGFFIGHDAGHYFRLGDQLMSTGQLFPNDGLLHHYALTVDGTATRLYVDGALVYSAGAISRGAGGNDTRLGRQYGGGAEFFHGAIDELWVFNTALSAGDVAQLAAAVPQRITIKSDAGTLAAATADFNRLDTGNASGLTFSAATVGAVGSTVGVPPGAPPGTEVINLTSGGGASGLFKATFTLPAAFAAPTITGAGNIDDHGRAFLNGNPLTPSLTAGLTGALTLAANSQFASSNASFFVPGVNDLVVSDHNSGGGPSGGSFYAHIDYLTQASLLPTINTHPVSQAVVVGAAANFSVTASGSALTYQWFRGTTAIAGATNATLTVTNAGLADIGDYTVAVSNAFGTATSRIAGLYVSGLTDPTARLVVAGPAQYFGGGGTVSFTATLNYSAPPTALGFSVFAPAGWSYVSGAGEPSVAPLAGDTGTLSWAYTGDFGSGASSFTFTLAYTGTLTGDQVIGGTAYYRTPLTNLVVPSVTLLRAASAIAGISPATIGPGLAVTITGVGFTGASAVTFNGVPASSFTVNSSSEIVAFAPAGVTAGPVAVTVGGVTVTSSTNYTVTLVPIIATVTPGTGPDKRLVRLTGANFQAAGGNGTVVRFNGAPATTALTYSDNFLSVAVPAGATSGPITVQTNYGTGTSATNFTVAGGPAPANDLFANATVLATASGGSVSGTNTHATKETGEPTHGGSAGGASVWFSWTPAASGQTVFYTTYTGLGDFGANLAVYTGTAVGALTPVASGNNGHVYQSYRSAVRFNATAGTTYRIALDGFDGLNGDFALTWAPIAAPTIASVSPTSVYAGQYLNITGAGFLPGATVAIGGATVSALNLDVGGPTAVAVYRVPFSAVTGPVSVTTALGTGTSTGNVTVTSAPAPTISGFAPTVGVVGTGVSITGAALSLGDAPPIVRFGGVQVTGYVSEGSNSIYVNVPAGAITGPISVQTSAGTGTSANPFVIAGPPTISSQPANVVAAVGGTASFAVTATSLAPITYQWFRDGRPLAGATNATLALTNLQSPDAGTYQVFGTNAAGTTGSNPVTLSGSGAAPTITTAPADLTVTSGATATLTVAASGATAYQWRRSGTPIAGATNASLALSPARRSDADYYDVLVYNGLTRSTSATARLAVAPTAYPGLVAFDAAAALLVESEDHAAVWSVAPLAGGRVLATGDFINVDGQRRHRAARFTAAGAFDPTFTPPQFDNTVLASVEQPDGKILVSGWFHAAGSVTRPFLARLFADGALDASFAPVLDGGVEAIALQADGKILAAGWFHNAGGRPRRGLARFNSDGTLDATLNASLDGAVLALAVQPDGQILIGGDFTTAGGTGRDRLARVSATGTLDATFNPNVSDQVLALALQSDGQVIIGGWFQSVGGQTRRYLARVTAAGALDTGFTPALDGGVEALAVQGDGALVIGGWFYSVNGQTRPYVARLSGSGAVDSSFAPTADSGVESLAIQPGGKILVGGFFATLGGSPRARVARLNSDGTLDALAPTVLRADGEVAAILAAPGGGFFFGGSFTHINDVPRRSLARITSVGTLDPAFNPPGVSGRVGVLALQGDGRLVLGGSFYQVAGVSRSGLARLQADGTLDLAFAPPMDGGEVASVLVQPDGRIVAGGDFSAVGPVARQRLARFQADGTLDQGFNPGADDRVQALALQRDGKLLVGGRFTTLASSGAANLGRLNADGTRDPLFLPQVNDAVDALAPQADGKVLLGGSFSQVGGTPTAHVARLNADGSRDSGFTPGTALSGGVLALLPQENGRILLGGWFQQVGSAVNTARLARLTAAGTRDSAFAYIFTPPALDPPRTLLLDDAGQLWVGGRHTSGFALARLVSFNGAAPSLSAPVMAAQAVNTGASVTLSVSATGTPAPTYQWRLDGNPIPGATNAAYVITGATAAHAGDYTVAITNPVGSVTAGPIRVDVLARDLVAASTRALVPAGGSIAAGFTIEGSVSKSILLRGVGPTLSSFSVANPLADPKLTLLDAGFNVVATNNDWGTNANAAAIASASAAVSAFALPANSKDAALLLTIGPGTYTAVLEGADGTGGIAHLEIFDADTGNQLRVVMFTARAPVGAAGDLHVTAFTVAGTGQKKFLLRALGESLGESNGILRDPVLTLFQGTTPLAENDDAFADADGLTAAVGAAGLRPLVATLDSTLLVKLGPGTYTAQIRGLGRAFGETFLELAQIDAGRSATIAPAITYLARDQQAIAGRIAAFGVNVLAKPAPAYQWRKNGVPLANDGRITGADGPLLRIAKVGPADAASYDVFITPGTIPAPQITGAPQVAALAAPGITSPARTLTILPQFHSADSNRDGRIDLFEIIRVLQLFAYTSGGVRTGEYRTQAGTEDGFAAGPGPITSFHSADTNRDGRIDVSELSRVILLYNFVRNGTRTGEYHPEVGTDDGFAPGAATSSEDL